MSVEHIAVIVAAVRARPSTSPTTWDDIREITSKTIGKKLTRQMLARYTDISDAYQKQNIAYQKIKKKVPAPAPKPGDPKDRRIATLEGELSKAMNTINCYDQRFITILHNARRLGFRREELEHPISKVNLEVNDR